MNDLVVVDLSHYNTVNSFEQAKAAGLLAVIHKATQGTTFSDPMYKSRETDARAAGLAWASYHYLMPGDIAGQMQFYMDFAKPAYGSRVCIDYEDAGLVLDDLHEAINYLAGQDASLQITIYGGSLLKQQLGADCDPILAEYALWLSQYTSGAPSWPSGTWPIWSLWQYSDGASGGSPRSIAGIADPVDCNAFNGSRDHCLKWFGTPEKGVGAQDIVEQDVDEQDIDEQGVGAHDVTQSASSTAADPACAEVAISISKPENVSLTLSVNGVNIQV